MKERTRSGIVAAIATVALVLGISTSTPVGAQEEPIRIAVVDLERVVAQSPAGRQLQARLQRFQEEVQAEAGTRNAAVRDIGMRLQEGAATLTEAQKAELQRQYESGQEELRRFADLKQREGQSMQQTGLAAIERDLEPVFAQLVAEHRYDVVLNNVPGVVVMISPRVDITQLVIARLVNQPGDGPAPELGTHDIFDPQGLPR